ncbi:MAG: class I SAM-dependent methyltransferase [Steroidobacteraceae bacterium]
MTLPSAEQLTASNYWEGRARRFAGRARGLAAVCSYGMPWLYNEAIDLCQRRALAPWLIGRSSASALDVGCGVGRWSVRLAARGMDVTGIDLSAFMVERAIERTEERKLSCVFLKADANSLRLDKRFDLILSVTVLQHIVDPDQAARAIVTLADHLTPNGELVLLEAAPSSATRCCDSGIFRARSFAWYQQALAQAGLRICGVRGVDPMPFKTALLPYYRHMPTPVATFAATVAAAISLPLDWWLAQYLPRRSWHKVMVARPSSAARS